MKMKIEALEKLKTLLVGNAEAEALLEQAEAGAAPAVDIAPAAAPVPVDAPVEGVDYPEARYATLREAYDKQRGRV